MKYIRLGLETLDKPIKRAGLFPSLEQLELLGVLIDFQVNKDMIRDFWRYLHDKEWGFDEKTVGMEYTTASTSSAVLTTNVFSPTSISNQTYGHSIEENIIEIPSDSIKQVIDSSMKSEEPLLPKISEDITNSKSDMNIEESLVDDVFKNAIEVDIVNTSTMIEKFGSIREFAHQLELFLTTSINHTAVASRIFNRIRSVVSTRQYQESMIKKTSDMDGELISDIAGVTREKGGGRNCREPLSITFSNLLAMFRRRAEMDENGTYFLCDLAEKTSIAESIDDVPLAFEARYRFCMAPIDTDNDMLMSKFRSFAVDYSQLRCVRLTDTAANLRVPQSPHELLNVETLHKVRRGDLLGKRISFNIVDYIFYFIITLYIKMVILLINVLWYIHK